MKKINKRFLKQCLTIFNAIYNSIIETKNTSYFNKTNDWEISKFSTLLQKIYFMADNPLILENHNDASIKIIS